MAHRVGESLEAIGLTADVTAAIPARAETIDAHNLPLEGHTAG